MVHIQDLGKAIKTLKALSWLESGYIYAESGVDCVPGVKVRRISGISGVH